MRFIDHKKRPTLLMHDVEHRSELADIPRSNVMLMGAVSTFDLRFNGYQGLTNIINDFVRGALHVHLPYL